MRIKVTTRGSALALGQTGMVTAALNTRGIETETITIVTTGDTKQGTPAASQNKDKRDWIHELEVAVENGSADLAIHSAKDVPALISAKTVLVPVLERANPYDAFIGRRIGTSGERLSFAQLPEGAVVGTASLRRKSQLLRLKPNLKVVPHRGNVPNRIEKLDASAELSGIILACAGLDRLNLPGVRYEPLSDEVLLPAINQGQLVAQVRADNHAVIEALGALTSSDTRAVFEAERSCIAQLPADCHSALSIYAEKKGASLLLRTRVLTPEGDSLIEVRDTGSVLEAKKLGERVGIKLLELGAEAILSDGK